MPKLGPGELGDVLEQPLVDGGILLSPVWHRWRDGEPRPRGWDFADDFG